MSNRKKKAMLRDNRHIRTSVCVFWYTNSWITRSAHFVFTILYLYVSALGPGHGLSGHMSTISRPVVTFQYRCDTSRDIIWCHDFGPLALLGSQMLALSHLVSLCFVLDHPKYVGPFYGFSRHISSCSRPFVKIKFRCDTSHDII